MSKHQSVIFIEGEGDAWFERNRARLGERDPVSDMIAGLGLKPTSVLEVGCANGWRLKKLAERYGCEVRGVDTSRAAVEAREVPTVQIGWADALPYLNATFDLVIFGFCLYVTDPREWLRIAAEADRVLRHGGYIIIHDFGNAGVDFAVKYAHHEGVLAYHADFTRLWLAHPWYSIVTSRLSADDHLVAVLHKNRNAIPVLP